MSDYVLFPERPKPGAVDFRLNVSPLKSISDCSLNTN